MKIHVYLKDLESAHKTIYFGKIKVGYFTIYMDAANPEEKYIITCNIPTIRDEFLCADFVEIKDLFERIALLYVKKLGFCLDEDYDDSKEKNYPGELKIPRKMGRTEFIPPKKKVLQVRRK